MRLASWIASFSLAASLGGASAPVDAGVPGSLQLNEFMAGPAQDWDGSGVFSSRDDEWIEVTNTGVTPLDLGGYLMTDGDSIPRYAFSGTLAAGARQVVFGGQATEWERATGHPAFGFSLANSGDAVLLWHVAGAETLLVDSYTYRSHEAAADRSVGRAVNGGGWELFDGLNPYTGSTPPPGNMCNPTPGGPNACAVTPARSMTWGRLKTMYR